MHKQEEKSPSKIPFINHQKHRENFGHGGYFGVVVTDKYLTQILEASNPRLVLVLNQSQLKRFEI